MDLFQISIIFSFVFAIIIGWIVGSKVKNSTLNFTVAGRSLSFTLVAIALAAQGIDGNATMGNTSLSYDFGFWAGASLPIGLAISLFILGAFFAKRLHDLKLVTLADLFERKFNKKVGFIAAIILVLGFGVILAGSIATLGILTEIFFHIKYETAVIISSLVVLIYVFRGGIISDIYVDIPQVAVIFLSIIGVFSFLFVTQGPIDLTGEFASKFSLSQFTSNAEGALINWATIVALGFGNLIAIDYAARIFSAKSGSAARTACYFGAILTLILGIPFSLLTFYILKMGIPISPDLPILVTFAKDALPLGFGVLLIVGVVNAALSTIDGAILSMGSILSQNLLGVRTDDSDSPVAEKTALYFLRICLIPITCGSIIFAIFFPAPGALLSVAFDITFAALLIPFVFAFTKYANAQAALYAIIVGGVSRIILATLTPTIFGLPNSFYIPNTIMDPGLDGVGTFIAPILALLTYVIVLNFGNEKKVALALDR